jgi:metallophosphoesterase superfamily enzyme
MKNNKRRYRLNDMQANFLGLKLKKINRYTLSEKQENLHLNTIISGYVTAEKSVNLKESINQNQDNTDFINTNRKAVFLDAFKNQLDIKDLPKNIKINNNGKRVLIIGDLHEPFCLENYLDHCLVTYKDYNCDTVVFIGDVIDNHASSYHETDPDGHSAGQELKLAIHNIKKWYKAFPNAYVTIGNHDRLIMRKAMTSGLSKMWIRDYAEVLGVIGWKFVESIEIDEVLYIHGEGGTARNRARRDLQSVVQGHLHTQCYIEWIVGSNFKIFGMQVGCGVDNKAYAMAYGKNYAKPAISCGVVEYGNRATNVMMEL